MRKIMTALLALSLLASCGPTPNEQALADRGIVTKTKAQKRAERSANLARNNAIWDQRVAVTVSGLRYEVGVSDDRAYALVAPLGQATFSLGEVEAAARSVTKCAAKGDGLLYLLGANGGSRIPVSALDKLSGRTRVELTC
jgi:hypothetical protein